MEDNLELERKVKELDALWIEQYPDPVDVFEDELAERLGLQRLPGLSQEEWRRARVQFINAQEEDDMVDEKKEATTDEPQTLKPERVQREKDSDGTANLKPERVQREKDQPDGTSNLKPERVQ